MIAANKNSVKIAKYLAACGVTSRRKAEELVKQGLISVNGKRMNDVAKRIDPICDKITFRGSIMKPAAYAYYLLNKPLGYTSSTKDLHAKKLVTSLVPQKPAVWPVGRLDKDTQGLILMTNDGTLTQKLTHPKYEKKKEYEFSANYPLTGGEIKKITNGISLEDGFLKPDRFSQIGDNRYLITIHSGKKRVIRRLLEHIGKQIIELKRVKIDFLSLEGLETGKWRALDKKEIERLLR
jgi:23S rRNA pseudouridine2605 synthase